MSKINIDWYKVFDAIGEGISIHSLDFEILAANKALAQVLGSSEDKLEGKKCYQIFHGLNCPKEGCPLEKSKVSKKTEKIEYFEPMLKVWVAVTASPIFNDKGEVESFVHLVQNITDRKEAEHKLQEKIKQLEKFNKVSVDRELKMIELKAENAKLKGKQKDV